jgi:hypothetical protein
LRYKKGSESKVRPTPQSLTFDVSSGPRFLYGLSTRSTMQFSSTLAILPIFVAVPSGREEYCNWINKILRLQARRTEEVCGLAPRRAEPNGSYGVHSGNLFPRSPPMPALPEFRPLAHKVVKSFTFLRVWGSWLHYQGMTIGILDSLRGLHALKSTGLQYTSNTYLPLACSQRQAKMHTLNQVQCDKFI